MIQLVELVTVDNENLAYHYASDDIDDVFNYEKKFNDLTKDIPLSFSSHILATEDSTFDSLCEKDPYFKQFRNYSDLTSFVKKTQEKSQLTERTLLTDDDIKNYHYLEHNYE